LSNRQDVVRYWAQYAAKAFGCDEDEIVGRTLRKQKAVTARQWVWLKLHDFQHWSTTEIASITGWESSTVQRGIRRARARLEASK